MPTLQIRNLPKHLYEKLKRSAAKSRRSLTQQTIFLLDQQLSNDGLSKKSKMDLLWEENDKIPNPEDATLEEIISWIREDRDQ